MAAWQASPVRGSAAPLPVVTLVPTPTNVPVPPAHAPAVRAHPFAELLRQSRDDGAASVAPHEHTLPVPRAEDAGASSETNEPASPAPAATKAKPRPATATTPKAASSAHPTDDAAGRVHGENETGASADDGGSHGAAPSGAAHGDGWIAQTIAGDRTLAATDERADAARGRAADADAQADILAASTGTFSGRADARASARVDANDARLAARAGQIGADADPRAATPMLAAALAEATRAVDAVPRRSGAEARIDALAPALGAGTASPAGEVRAASAPTELALATPIDSPDFGAAFGVQVCMLAKDGVQQAELHLNPAETGPVSIQIAVDGSNARIDFGADLAATRAAIEKSLPELAAALRDAGLTLTGGGVSQHAGGRAPSGDDDGSPAPRADARANAAGGAAPAMQGTRRVSAGGVDLYA